MFDEYVRIYDDFLSPENLEICVELCSQATALAAVGSERAVKGDIRRAFVEDFDLENEETLEKNNKIASCFWEQTKKYIEVIKFSEERWNENWDSNFRLEPLSFLRYPGGCFYTYHSDGPFLYHCSTLTMRQLSYVLFVNDEYSGGHLHFPAEDRTITPRENRLVLFPSNWCFGHQVKEVIKGVKKSVVTWGGPQL